jgi:hypothetical protein
MVPRAYGGERTLRNFRYRGATLTVTVRGFGDSVARASLDGRPLRHAELRAGLTGAHEVEIDMNGRWPDSAVTVVTNHFAPATPRAERRGDCGQRGACDTLAWAPVAGATGYEVHRDGRRASTTTDTLTSVARGDALAEYQVLAVDSAGIESFLSEPVRVVIDQAVQIVRPPARYLEREGAAATDTGFVRLTRERNTTVEIPVRVSSAGTYAIDVLYANGSGPVNSDSKAAMRTLSVDGKEAGVLVMPQRGTDLWTDWGYSNPLRMRLEAGAHTLTIAYTAVDQNMSRVVNTALLRHVRLTRLPAGQTGASRGP